MKTIWVIANKGIRFGGGLEKVALNLIQNISVEKQKKIIVLYNSNESLGMTVYRGIRCVNMGEIRKPVYLKPFLVNQFSFSRRCIKYIEQNGTSNDVIWIQGTEYAFPFVFSKLSNRIIVTAHGFQFFEKRDYFLNHPNLVMKILGGVSLLYYLGIDLISLCSIDTLVATNQEIFSFASFFRKRTYLLYNGADEKLTKKGAMSKLTNLNCTIIGSTAIRKGLDLAINSVKLFNDSNTQSVQLSLTIVGFKGHKPKYAFEKYMGIISNSKAKSILSKSHFLFLPSRHESFPVTVLESVQCSTPFIVSKNCHSEELPNWSKCGIVVKSYRSSDFCKAIEKLLANYSSYSANAIKLDLQKYPSFNWKSLGAKYDEILEK